MVAARASRGEMLRAKLAAGVQLPSLFLAVSPGLAQQVPGGVGQKTALRWALRDWGACCPPSDLLGTFKHDPGAPFILVKQHQVLGKMLPSSAATAGTRLGTRAHAHGVEALPAHASATENVGGQGEGQAKGCVCRVALRP